MGRKRVSEGGCHCKRRPYVATVEGVEHGVPFRTFYKRMDVARNDAIETGGTLIDLADLKHWRWVNGKWSES